MLSSALATVENAMNNIKSLIFDEFIRIAIRCDSKKDIAPVICAIAAEIVYTVGKEIIILKSMHMSRCAEKYIWKEADIMVERFYHIVVELLIEWWRMHANHSTLVFPDILIQFGLHIVEIRNRLTVVIFESIGIKANELHVSGDE